MLNFLFRRRADATVEVKTETQREAFTRIVEELNALLDKEGVKPAVTFEPATGHITFKLPEQLSDEALALPAPEAAQSEPEAITEKVDEDATTLAETVQDASAEATKAVESAKAA